MKKLASFITLSIIIILLSGCYAVETSHEYNHRFTWAKSTSKPIYLRFKDTKSKPFYFLLSRNTKENGYKLIVRWKNAKSGDLLFNGNKTTLKFFIDKEIILTFKPIKRPKIVSYNMNSGTHEEEGIFSLSEKEFTRIAYATSVMTELTGRYNTVMGEFSSRNTKKAFRNFAEKSH
ncbi:MAG: hypothetical protein COA94_07965 [Rickettsiales bacterium]|nr:MAG: hypothetical protein COA94_07965 [Rickettsiales bacterium]